jgi:hypothetical protein
VTPAARYSEPINCFERFLIFFLALFSATFFAFLRTLTVALMNEGRGKPEFKSGSNFGNTFAEKIGQF